MRIGRPKDRELVKFKDLPKLVLEVTGLSRSRVACYVWVRHGLVGYTGHIIKLRTTKRRGNLYTTRKWLEDFIKELGSGNQTI